MVSLGICFLSAVNHVIQKPRQYYPHFYNLPYPQVIHKYLDSTFIEKYEEIFVIGDIHGCYDELRILLKDADANKDSVLKIFVGDLVNKGPKNAEVLDLVRTSPSMLSVRGNHDEIVLKEYISSKSRDYNMNPKYLWIKDLSPENIDYLKELPYTISLPSLNAIIVHAGLLPGTHLENNSPYNMVHMRNIIETDVFWEGGLQGTNSDTEGDPWASLWCGPEHIYFGHDAKRKLQTYPYATGLDTGCVYGNWLTGLFIYGPRKGTFMKVKALKMHSKPKGTD